jgi:tetratricopeptide (TPR) repeat protein
MSDEPLENSGRPENLQGPASENLLIKLHHAGKQLVDGNMAEAELAYEIVLEQEPDNKFANQLLGGIALQKGDFVRAHKFMSKALAVDPSNEELNSNLGIVLIKLQRLDEAIQHFEQALAVQPGYAAAHNALGTALREQGNAEKALIHHIQALAAQPNDHRMRNNYANSLKELGRSDEAIEQYFTVLESAYDDSDTHYNLGVLFEFLEQLDRACDHYEKALKTDPNHPEINFNLGNVLQSLGQLESAIEKYKKVIEVMPDHDKAHVNLGHALLKSDDKRGAEYHWRRTLVINNEFADAHVNLALLSFEQGNISEGWDGFEWRNKAENYESPHRHFPQLNWDGSPLKGKEIILWGEMGLGDEISYASMIPDVLRQGGKVTIECTQRLVPLFTRSFEGAEVYAAPYAPAEDGNRSYDFHSSFPSLGRYLRNAVEDFPSIDDEYIYLKADPSQRAYWQEQLESISDKPKIGLCWSSNLVKDEFRHFYASIQDMEPLLSLIGVDFVCLVPANVDDDIAKALIELGVSIHVMKGLDLKQDLDGVAALISSLDIVVSCLSTVTELAGALGVRTLGFIGESIHPQWMGTDDVLWFPNTHYHAKQKSKPWKPLFIDISLEVKNIFELDY